jgi:flagellar biosynthesis GTPase FlhF
MRYATAPQLPVFYEADTATRLFRSPRRATELSMGLRSILGKVRRHKDDDHDEDDDYAVVSPGAPEDLSDNPTAAAGSSKAPSKTFADLNISLSAVDLQVNDPPLRMGEDPNSKEINVNLLDQSESVQERINRVKSGKMTQEEKEAFLNAALSTGTTPESRLPLRPPVSSAELDENRPRASPFPEDPILRSIAGGKEPAPAIKAGIDSQKKKREYLDMVTNPKRFDVFQSQPSHARLNPSAPMFGKIRGEELTEPIADVGDSPPISPPAPVVYQQSTLSQTPSAPVVESSASLNPAEPYSGSDLGTRLEAAAIAQEQQRKEAEEAKRLRELEEMENQRLAQAEAAEEEVRRQVILAEREKEYRERRRREEETSTQEAAKAQEAEQRRLEAMIAAQESYWVQKLAKERQSRNGPDSIDEVEPRYTPALDSIIVPDPLDPPPVPSPPPPPPLAASPVTGTHTVQEHLFNPDESKLLSEEDGGRNPVRRGNISPLPSVGGKKETPRSPTFLNDVASIGRSSPRAPVGRRSQREIEDDEQLQRLRQLNSPLPSSATTRYEKKQAAASSFQPQRAVSTAYSAPKPAPVPTPVPAPVYANPSLASPPPTPVTRPAPAPSAFLPLRQTSPPRPAPASNPLTSLFGGNKQEAKSVPAPTPASAPPAKRKGPIRMQLPLGDDDDDDFDDEEGIDAGSNKQMSLGDAMKKSGNSGDQDLRSKKWGIDITKFT